MMDLGLNSKKKLKNNVEIPVCFPQHTSKTYIFCVPGPSQSPKETRVLSCTWVQYTWEHAEPQGYEQFRRVTESTFIVFLGGVHVTVIKLGHPLKTLQINLDFD